MTDENRFKAFDKSINSLKEPVNEAKKSSMEFFKTFNETLVITDPILKANSEIKFPNDIDDYCWLQSPNGDLYVEYLIILPESHVKITPQTPGHVSIDFDNNFEIDAIRLKVFKSWSDNGKSLNPKKFLRWAESNMTKATNILKSNHSIKQSKCKQGFIVTVKNPKGVFNICVAFSIKLTQGKNILPKNNTIDYWKASPGILDEKHWQCCFGNSEANKFNNLNKLNNTMKLMKRVRNKNNMSFVSNYMIKTLFLQQVDAQEKSFWNKNAGYILWHMLSILKNALEQQKILFYWDQRLDLLKTLKADQIRTGHLKIEQTLASLILFCSAPSYIYTLLLNDEELKEYQSIIDAEPIPSPAKPSNNAVITQQTRYRILEQYLNEIHLEFNRPDNKVKTNYKIAYDDFIDAFRSILYANNTVLKAYKRIRYTGSVADGLSIGKTIREFDLDLLIALPSNMTKVKKSSAGFITIELELSKNFDPVKAEIIKKWLDPQNFIVPEKFKRWLESVLTKIIEDQKINGQIMIEGKKNSYTITMAKSGPAFTMNVHQLNSDIKFLADFVFALEFQDWPFESTKNGINIKEWLAIPKNPTEKSKNCDISWRYSFPGLEKEKLKDNRSLKTIVKLIKRFRDADNMPYLSSYYIKTLFLFEVDGQNQQFWKNNLGYLFMFMLGKLKKGLENKKIPFYWDKNCNLFDRLSPSQIEDGYIKVKRLMDLIDKCIDEGKPETIKKLFVPNNER